VQQVDINLKLIWFIIFIQARIIHNIIYMYVSSFYSSCYMKRAVPHVYKYSLRCECDAWAIQYVYHMFLLSQLGVQLLSKSHSNTKCTLVHLYVCCVTFGTKWWTKLLGGFFRLSTVAVLSIAEGLFWWSLIVMGANATTYFTLVTYGSDPVFLSS